MRELRTLLCLTAAAWMAHAAVSPAGAQVIDRSRMASIARIDDLRVDDRTVSGVLVNQTGDALLNVRLFFEDRFLWTNEFRPGTDDPGESAVFTVSTVPPRSSVPFHFDRPPRPERTDGHFEPQLTVIGLVQQPTAPATAALPTGRTSAAPAEPE